jgi:hypothetical protein
MSEDSYPIPCSVCQKLFKKKVPWQENCSDKCRAKAFRLKQAAKIADQIREDVYKMLVERLVK